MSEFAFTAAQLMSPRILTMNSAARIKDFKDDNGSWFVNLRFKTIADASAYVWSTGTEDYMHINSPVTDFTSRVVVTFAYTAYQQAGDRYHSYTGDNEVTRRTAYILN